MILAPSRQLIEPNRCMRCGRLRVRSPRQFTRQRYAPRWGRPRAADMLMGDGIQISSSGPVIGTGGIMVGTSGDPCCCLDSCGQSGTRATSYTATFSSVALSSTCVFCSVPGVGPRYSRGTAGLTFSGTFSLTNFSIDGGSECTYITRASAGNYYLPYTTSKAGLSSNMSDCVSHTQVETDSIQVILEFSAASGAFIEVLLRGGTSGFFEYAIVFQAQTNDAPTSYGSRTISNGISAACTTGYSGTFVSPSSGGSVALVAIP